MPPTRREPALRCEAGSEGAAGYAGRAVPSRASASAHVFVTDLDSLQLGETDRHHLDRSLRLRAGETVSVADGSGAWMLCSYTGSRGRLLEPLTPATFEPAPSPPVTVAFAVIKGDRSSTVVQKLTEAGADRILPFSASRSVARWDPAKAGTNVSRLRRVAREAAMQCRRTRIPEVAELVSFDELVGSPGMAERGCLAERGGGPLSLERPAIAVGPEGGWAPNERACGLPLVGLGQNVMRSDTAALAAGVLLCAMRSGEVPSRHGR